MATMSVRGECFWILQVSAQRRRPARAKMAALPAELAQGWAEQETVKATASSIAETADSFAFALTTTAGDFATTPRGLCTPKGEAHGGEADTPQIQAEALAEELFSAFPVEKGCNYSDKSAAAHCGPDGPWQDHAQGQQARHSTETNDGATNHQLQQQKDEQHQGLQQLWLQQLNHPQSRARRVEHHDNGHVGDPHKHAEGTQATDNEQANRTSPHTYTATHSPKQQQLLSKTAQNHHVAHPEDTTHGANVEVANAAAVTLKKDFCLSGQPLTKDNTRNAASETSKALEHSSLEETATVATPRAAESEACPESSCRPSLFPASPIPSSPSSSPISPSSRSCAPSRRTEVCTRLLSTLLHVPTPPTPLAVGASNIASLPFAPEGDANVTANGEDGARRDASVAAAPTSKIHDRVWPRVQHAPLVVDRIRVADRTHTSTQGGDEEDAANEPLPPQVIAQGCTTR
eukprot:GHVT01070754.1.p1 GENE.GHVT01070754.1~~GHVT01070754.1.p1  ORF type:complete len:462 (-),score=81.95 GHVT01070754.1:709-2094(-)